MKLTKMNNETASLELEMFRDYAEGKTLISTLTKDFSFNLKELKDINFHIISASYIVQNSEPNTKELEVLNRHIEKTKTLYPVYFNKILRKIDLSNLYKTDKSFENYDGCIEEIIVVVYSDKKITQEQFDIFVTYYTELERDNIDILQNTFQSKKAKQAGYIVPAELGFEKVINNGNKYADYIKNKIEIMELAISKLDDIKKSLPTEEVKQLLSKLNKVNMLMGSLEDILDDFCDIAYLNNQLVSLKNSINNTLSKSNLYS